MQSAYRMHAAHLALLRRQRCAGARTSAPQMRPCLCTACCTADGAGALGSRGGCDRALACGTPRAASPSPESSVSFGLPQYTDTQSTLQVQVSDHHFKCAQLVREQLNTACVDKAYREAKNSRRRSGHFVPHSDEPPWSSHSSGDEDLVDRPSASSVGFLRGEWPVDVEARARHRCDWSTTSPLARKATGEKHSKRTIGKRQQTGELIKMNAMIHIEDHTAGS
eukprot:6186355-Pleurochrysis_carterae.AAC.2